MAGDYNRTILVGRLARDPDIRTTQNGQKTVRFTLCCGRKWKNKTTGEMQEHTDFISVSAWGNIADVIERYVKKGNMLLVEGRINTYDYDDTKSGTHKWVTEVMAETVRLMGSKSDGQNQSQGGYSNGYQPTAASGGNGGSLRGDAGYNDDFPLDFSDLAMPNTGGDVEIPF